MENAEFRDMQDTIEADKLKIVACDGRALKFVYYYSFCSFELRGDNSCIVGWLCHVLVLSK